MVISVTMNLEVPHRVTQSQLDFWLTHMKHLALIFQKN